MAVHLQTESRFDVPAALGRRHPCTERTDFVETRLQLPLQFRGEEGIEIVDGSLFTSRWVW